MRQADLCIVCMLGKQRELLEEVPWKRGGGGGGYFVTEEVAMNLLDKEKLVRGSCLKILDAKMK